MKSYTWTAVYIFQILSIQQRKIFGLNFLKPRKQEKKMTLFKLNWWRTVTSQIFFFFFLDLFFCILWCYQFLIGVRFWCHAYCDATQISQAKNLNFLFLLFLFIYWSLIKFYFFFWNNNHLVLYYMNLSLFFLKSWSHPQNLQNDSSPHFLKESLHQRALIMPNTKNKNIIIIAE